jgi:hypothetical protein
MIVNVAIVMIILAIIMTHTEGFSADEIRKKFIDSKAEEFSMADGSISGDAFCTKVKSGAKCVAGAGTMGDYLGQFFECKTVPGMKSGAMIKYKCDVPKEKEG